VETPIDPSLLDRVKRLLDQLRKDDLKELHNLAKSAGGLKMHRDAAKRLILRVGDSILALVDQHVAALPSNSSSKTRALDMTNYARHLWHYAAAFTKLNGSNLRKLYERSRDEYRNEMDGSASGQAMATSRVAAVRASR